MTYDVILLFPPMLSHPFVGQAYQRAPQDRSLAWGAKQGEHTITTLTRVGGCMKIRNEIDTEYHVDVKLE